MSVWTGVKFTCAECRAEYELEERDKCTVTHQAATFAFYDVPPCIDCGLVNNVTIATPETTEIGGS